LAIDDLNNAARDNGLKFRFYVNGFKFINNSGAIKVADHAERALIAGAYRTLGAVNVHVVDEITGDLLNETYSGIVEPGYSAAFVERDVLFDEITVKTFTHEIGHYFGLLHTHFGSGVACVREPVTRGYKITACLPITSKRCRRTGDLLCDTDADPNMSDFGIYNNGDCTWNANGTTDQYGQTYHPDPLNYMAYGNDDTNANCVTHFTEGQKRWMLYWIFGERLESVVVGAWLKGPNNAFDVYEPDNAAVAARPVEYGATQNHTFHKAARIDNTDWLKFVHDSFANEYKITITSVTPNAVADAKLYLTQADTVVSEVSLSATTQGNKKIYTVNALSLQPNKTYAVKITKGTDNSTYQVVVDQVVSLAIAGPAAVCTSNTTFTLQNRPSAYAVTWSKSSNLVYVSGQGTNNYVVKAASSTSGGSGWVKATIATDFGNFVSQKDVQSGPFSSSQLIVTGTSDVCPGNNYVYTAAVPGGHQSGYTYQWTKPSNWSLNYQSANSISYYVPANSPDYGAVQASIYNGCGSYSGYSGITVFPGYSCGGSFSLSVFPNPASSDLTIALLADESVAAVESDGFSASAALAPEPTEFQLRLIDFSGEVVLTETCNGTSVSLNVGALPAGIYLVKVFMGGEVLTERLLIQ